MAMVCVISLDEFIKEPIVDMFVKQIPGTEKLLGVSFVERQNIGLSRCLLEYLLRISGLRFEHNMYT